MLYQCSFTYHKNCLYPFVKKKNGKNIFALALNLPFESKQTWRTGVEQDYEELGKEAT